MEKITVTLPPTIGSPHTLKSEDVCKTIAIIQDTNENLIMTLLPSETVKITLKAFLWFRWWKIRYINRRLNPVNWSNK